MNFAKSHLKLFKQTLISGVKNISITVPFKKTEEYNQKMNQKNIIAFKKRDSVQETNHIDRTGFIRSIFEVFGYTAVMSIPVLFMMVLLILSFVLNDFLEAIRGYALLTLGLSVLMLGVGWYKPYKFWTFMLFLAGAFLTVLAFGPQVIEGYTGKTLTEVNWKNGYWVTLQATFVFLCTFISSVSLIAWVFLVSKGQRQNPFKRLRMLNLNRRLTQLKKRLSN
ncbi:hypothetical protein M9R32_08825 [Paenisporosarcina quisquiliarum]|uniref:Uncharacterized protein n=1 Tax=Paenisporosarcina quisquiliarum TaxID=365346 RepID=A0A9X3LG48_9BACL|nr:hypothetical protein [Paenisporosarcina quisquiliarum]MCZ8537281.1 hypothetical protein [Paenisporosarcina quisquiliarum]